MGFMQAMNGYSKKERERRILRCVYNEGQFDSVVPHECPDFVIHRHLGQGCFGVEITELYASHPEARLERVPGYFGELMDGKMPRHKDDIIALEVKNLQLIGPDGSVKADKVPGIMLGLPSVTEYRKLLAGAITMKGAKRAAYDNSLDYVNLIVRDHIGLLTGNKREDFSALVFDESMKRMVASSGFQEIFVVTRIDGNDLYIPLVSLTLVSELYAFDEALKKSCTYDDIEDWNEFQELFAQFLSIRGFAAHISRRDDGVEVILGVTGVMLDDEKGTVLRNHSDFPLPACELPPQPGTSNWRLPQAVVSAHGSILNDLVFSSPIAFDVIQTDRPIEAAGDVSSSVKQ